MPALGPFTTVVPLVLASASPRRSELLASAGLDFSIEPSRAPEPDPLPGEKPDNYALRCARAKALEVAARHPGAVVLAADTIVVLGDEIMGKPQDDADARAMLGRLCGRNAVKSGTESGGDDVNEPSADPTDPDAERSHYVTTGCCLVPPKSAAMGGECACGIPDYLQFTASTEVMMGLQDEATIAAYVTTGEPSDKAGAYAIQGQGAFLVRGVSGSYTNVVGLPLARVLEVLRMWGVTKPCNA